MVMLLSHVIYYEVRFTTHGHVKTHDTARLPIVMLVERV